MRCGRDGGPGHARDQRLVVKIVGDGHGRPRYQKSGRLLLEIAEWSLAAADLIHRGP